jgi:Predicted membrane protein
MLNYLQILLIGCSLALDAFTVTIAHSLSGSKKLWRLPLAFALFQGIMPLIGFAAGHFALSQFDVVADYVATAVLVAVGANMIFQSVKNGKKDEEAPSNLTWGIIIASAVATSIDALAVGVTLPEMSVNPFISAALIAVITLIICFVGVVIGRSGKNIIKMKNPEIIGGAVIILIGLKTLIFHFV